MPQLRLIAFWLSIVASAIISNSFSPYVVGIWLLLVLAPITFLFWTSRND